MVILRVFVVERVRATTLFENHLYVEGKCYSFF